ncbi:hypothetical protein OKW38_002750 [Paraburkholderia sp. MM5496-R1]|uniref:hypothetical protein n=1 Tax=Paraburkholderia sp. MM5496-R1 TaxID=2991065 RepID=UPI003D22E492
MSDAEQERLAKAIKTDLVAVHQGHLKLNPGDVQAMRLLLIAHRQGTSPTPLLELRRDAMAPGPLPGTIRLRTVKFRSKKIRSSVARAEANDLTPTIDSDGDEIVFNLAEGAVLQQAITSTDALVREAPARYKSRIWLFRSQERATTRAGKVTCLTSRTLAKAINALIARHNLVGDNGKLLRLNLSRTRKSFFDRAFRHADGDLAKTANLMGNTPPVAALNYPSMNEARKAEAAGFMNEDYIDRMRGAKAASTKAKGRVIKIRPGTASTDGSPSVSTPVSGCRDTLNGEHAPGDGHNHCDRYVMCLFCSSFAIVGTVDELWRLFSFQVFAKNELNSLDSALGPERTGDEALEDLRDRYRIAIPYIDNFTKRQFAARIVKEARTKTKQNLHPFWVHQMTMSRRARAHR